MRVVKSISLPVHLAEKAQEFDNLSVFVQDCISYGIESNVASKQDRINNLKKDKIDLECIIEELTDYLLEANNSLKLKSMRQKMKKLLIETGWIE